jgi:hypothetical protein
VYRLHSPDINTTFWFAGYLWLILHPDGASFGPRHVNQLLSKLHLLTPCSPLLRSSGIQEDSESEAVLPEPTSSTSPVDIVGRPSGSSVLLPASSTDRKVLR